MSLNIVFKLWLQPHLTRAPREADAHQAQSWVEVAAVVYKGARDIDYASADHVSWVVRIIVQPRRAYPAF